MIKYVGLIVACLSTIFGCTATRVNLGPLPSIDAPKRERIAAYEKYGKAEEKTQELLHADQMYRGGASHPQYLLLKDMTKVYDAQDLLPLVDENSITAKHIRAGKVSKNIGTALMIGGSAIVIGGLVYGVSGEREWKEKRSDHRYSYGNWKYKNETMGALVSLGGLVVTVGGLFLLEYVYVKAFDSYSGDLMSNLGLSIGDFDISIQ